MKAHPGQLLVEVHKFVNFFKVLINQSLQQKRRCVCFYLFEIKMEKQVFKPSESGLFQNVNIFLSLHRNLKLVYNKQIYSVCTCLQGSKVFSRKIEQVRRCSQVFVVRRYQTAVFGLFPGTWKHNCVEAPSHWHIQSSHLSLTPSWSSELPTHLVNFELQYVNLKIHNLLGISPRHAG